MDSGIELVFEDCQIENLNVLNEANDFNENISSSTPITSDSDKLNQSSRKRYKRCENWKANEAKKTRQSGQKYINKTGKIVEARSVKQGHGKKCRLSCSTKLSKPKTDSIYLTKFGISKLMTKRGII